MNKRIWELDAARGICIAGMVVIHLIYDITVLFPLFSPPASPLFSFMKDWGGVLFLLISGISVTLGSRPVKRGILVFSCGVLCSLVTWAMARFWGFGDGIRIRFGVLHCLGLCMMLWPVLGKLSVPLLSALGAAIVGIGFYFLRLQTVSPYLFPLGLCRADFSSADYFPIFPYLGFFALGAVLGRTLYPTKQSLFPSVSSHRPLIRFFLRCGQLSLPIYLLHQPVLACLAGAIFLIR